MSAFKTTDILRYPKTVPTIVLSSTLGHGVFILSYLICQKD